MVGDGYSLSLAVEHCNPCNPTDIPIKVSCVLSNDINERRAAAASDDELDADNVDDEYDE